MLTEDYTVRLANFQGPLDLLLFLIRRAEVDITEVSVADITDQYLHYLGDLQQIDVEAAGEFLVTAAALLEIKSRLLAPPGEDQAGSQTTADYLERAEPGNPAADLIRQLLAYRRFRDAADRLERHRALWDRRYPLPSLGDPVGGAGLVDDSSELEDLNLFDLVRAYARISETVQFDRLGDHRIVADDTPIELHAADVLDRLRRSTTGDTASPRMTMREIFASRNRAEVIGLFLAILELVRQRAVRVEVDPQTRDISVALRDPDEAEQTPNEPLAPAIVESEEKDTAPQPVGWDDDDPFDQEEDDDEDGRR